MKWGLGRLAPVLLVALGSVACGSSPGDGTPGELGAGTFHYVCANDGDVKCSQTGAVDSRQVAEDLGGQSSVPYAVAVGAHFNIEYAGTQRSGFDEQLVRVQPVVSSDELAPSIFAIAQPAEATFMAVDNQGEVVDFIAVEALEATALKVWYDEVDIEDLSIKVGEKVEITVTPLSAADTLLAGSLAYEWVSLSPGRVTIGALGEDADEDRLRNEGDIEVLGVKAGTSVVRVRSGDLEKMIEVEVTP